MPLSIRPSKETGCHASTSLRVGTSAVPLSPIIGSWLAIAPATGKRPDTKYNVKAKRMEELTIKVVFLIELIKYPDLF